MPDPNPGQPLPESQQPPEKKIPSNDPSLRLVKRPLNRKTLRVLVFVAAGVVAFGVFIGLASPNHKPKQTAQQSGKPDYTDEVPGSLGISPSDYSPIHGEKPLGPQYAPAGENLGGQAPQGPSYGTYPRVSGSEQRTARFLDQQPAAQQPNVQTQPPSAQAGQPSPRNASWPSFGVSPESDEEKRRTAALTSTFFFPWTPATSDQHKEAGSQSKNQQQPAGNMSDQQAQALQAAYDSPYTKQNMAAEKQKFLENQKGDFSAYLDNRWISPVDSQHILQAGTLIPITMITGINSDLPGTIISQVTENVFDSLTGQNILIPRGSRLIGTYDNAIAFGQDRVLVAWERLIRTDGVSISLRGMKGADLQGKAGLHDQVDYHVQQILAVLGAATVFNVGTNAAISALSTNQFLSSLAAAMTAQGSTSNNVTTAANAAAIDYANKIIDQQPTIIIREGTRADCLIDKDMILPAFVDDEGGYEP